MTRLRNICRDQQGAAAVEMAFALPILLLFVFGIFQFGVILLANAGMQHALGEGARFATLFPTPANSEIVTRMDTREFGMNFGTFNTPTVTTPATGVCVKCRDLTVTYTVTPSFIVVSGPTINLSRTKRVYTAT